LLRLLSHVIGAGRRAGKPVSLCGEIGGDVNFTALLLALGLKEFSMHPSQILHVRDRLATLNHATLRQHAPLLIRSRTHEEAELLLANIVSSCHP
jgi:phosphotransferase system enzyme I (PtsI)